MDQSRLKWNILVNNLFLQSTCKGAKLRNRPRLHKGKNKRTYRRESILSHPKNDSRTAYTPTKLVDISEEKLSKSIALSKYQDKENLKRVATMYAELGDLGLQSREEFRTRIKGLQKQAHNEKRTVADLDKKIREFNQILTFAKRYAENKKYGDNYQRSKDKERYEREHDYQLRLYEGAKSWLKNTGIDPATLKIRDIEEHLRKLEVDQKAFPASSVAKAAEQKRLSPMEESLTKFLDEPDISEPLRHTDQNRGF